MTKTITIEHLDFCVRELNDMFGHATTRFRKENGSFVPNPGTFWLQINYGKVSLYRNTPLGVTKVIQSATKEEACHRLVAFMDGAQLMNLKHAAARKL